MTVYDVSEASKFHLFFYSSSVMRLRPLRDSKPGKNQALQNPLRTAK